MVFYNFWKFFFIDGNKLFFFFINGNKLGELVHTCKHSTWEAEAGEQWVLASIDSNSWDLVSEQKTCKTQNPNHILSAAMKQNTNEWTINPQNKQTKPGNELFMLYWLIKNLYKHLLLRSVVISKEKHWKILCFCGNYTPTTIEFVQKIDDGLCTVLCGANS